MRLWVRSCIVIYLQCLVFSSAEKKNDSFGVGPSRSPPAPANAAANSDVAYREEPKPPLHLNEKNLWNRGKYLGDDDIDQDYYQDTKGDPAAIAEDHEGDDEDTEEDTADEDAEDSDVSEERRPELYINRPDLQRVGAPNSNMQNLPEHIVSVINRSFQNKKSFSCPQIKTDLVTGTSVGDLSPEDIGIIAAMGDALATGVGLWPHTDIEFRGAAFPIGGDASIDGLVTVPNILREFNKGLLGVSHGMGSRDQLPDHQLNVAEAGASSSDMPAQAQELVHRLGKLHDVDYHNQWVMVIITIGTEEICSSCKGPNTDALLKAIKILHKNIPKAFVVLLGPVHVSRTHDQTANLLKTRCFCSRNQSQEFMLRLSSEWSDAVSLVQKNADENPYKRPTFGVLSFPMLTITSRYPYSLFIKHKPLLNRRGHNYASKWLWNRLIAGEKYNVSSAILSSETYFCPSTGCPYFRTTANARSCQLLSKSEAKDSKLSLGEGGRMIKRPRRTRKKLYTIAGTVVLIAFCVVFTMATIFYQKSKQARHGRFDFVEEAQLKFEEAQKEEERALIERANSRQQDVGALS